MSGGGAVYHDSGNLNYTYISQNSGDDFLNFEKFTKPVIEVLKSLGVNATLSGRNDMLIGDKKFSGNGRVEGLIALGLAPPLLGIFSSDLHR